MGTKRKKFGAYGKQNKKAKMKENLKTARKVLSELKDSDSNQNDHGLPSLSEKDNIRCATKVIKKLSSNCKINGEDVSSQIKNNEGNRCTSNEELPPYEHNFLNESTLMENHIENRDIEKKTIGRRIINVSHLFEELQKISSHGPLNCGLESIEIISERLTGLDTKLTLKCRLCNMKFIINGDNSSEEMNLNTCAVAGVINAGCGHRQLQEITSTLGLPEIWPKLYNSHMKIVNSKWESELLKSMNDTAEEERRAAVEEGRVSTAGIAIIDVIADGCWAKRSYKKNYSSLSGAAAILGKRTNKILFMAVKNKFCCICARAENKGVPAKEHICYKNYTGPSTGMESTIIVEGFKKSIEMHNLIYGRIISDGDANTYSKLLQERPYKNLTIEKIECRNHLLRNFCNKLQNVTTETKYLIRFRKLVTKKRILSMRKVVVTAIKKHKDTDNPMQLHNDIMLAADHAFSNHNKCKEYFCDKCGDTKDADKELFRNSLWQKIKLILSQLAAHSRSLMHDVDSNSVERYHSIVAKYVGGKRINFTQKFQYQMRCNGAALSFNTKKPLSLLHKSIIGKSPRGKIHKLEARRMLLSEKNKKYLKIKRRKFDKKINSGENYGENCMKPDISEEMMKEGKIIFLKNLEKTEDERKKIEKDTILQSDSSEWLELRRNLLTASNFGRVVKRRDDLSCINFVKDLIYKKPLDHVHSIRHGREKEIIAKKQLESEMNLKIQDCGLFLDAKIPFLGASPDGVIDENTICEIKCPISAYKMGLENAIAEKKIPFYRKTKNNNYAINKDHNWYYQIQGQLHITQKNKCIFALWSNENTTLRTEIIYKDDHFWETKMEHKLTRFYTECVLPELVDPRVPRKLPIRDPIYIMQAISQKLDTRKEKQKKIKENETEVEVNVPENITFELDEPQPKRVCMRKLSFFEL